MNQFPHQNRESRLLYFGNPENFVPSNRGEEAEKKRTLLIGVPTSESPQLAREHAARLPTVTKAQAETAAKNPAPNPFMMSIPTPANVRAERTVKSQTPNPFITSIPAPANVRAERIAKNSVPNPFMMSIPGNAKASVDKVATAQAAEKIKEDQEIKALEQRLDEQR